MSWRAAFYAPVRVASFRQQRPARRAVSPPPETGLRWGAASDFDYLLPERSEAEEEERRGVTTIRKSPEYRSVERTTRFSPVWRRYEVWRVKNSGPDEEEGEEKYIDVTVTLEMLLPIGSESQHYIGGGIGYVVDPGRYVGRDRVIHSYVLLELTPPSFSDAEKISEGTVGDWPSYREDIWSGGSLAAGV